MTPEKPKRTFSRATVVGTLVPAWATIIGSMAQGPAMAAIIAPSMVLLIMGVVGLYQGVGHADLRAQLLRAARDEKESS